MFLYLENLFYLKSLCSQKNLFSLEFIFSLFSSSLFSPYSPHRGDMGGLSLPSEPDLLPGSYVIATDAVLLAQCRHRSVVALGYCSESIATAHRY